MQYSLRQNNLEEFFGPTIKTKLIDFFLNNPKGYRGVSVREIAEELGLDQKNLYAPLLDLAKYNLLNRMISGRKLIYSTKTSKDDVTEIEFLGDTVQINYPYGNLVALEKILRERAKKPNVIKETDD